MFKKIKEWLDDYNYVQQELNSMGFYTAYHQWGAITHYVEPEKTTHINTLHDKHRTIPSENTRTKGHRKV
jgi:flagellar capping protein FliD